MVYILLLSIFLSGCAYSQKIINSTAFSVRACLRDRQYDEHQNYTIAVWIDEVTPLRSLADIQSFQFKLGKSLVSTDKDIAKNCYTNQNGGLGYFYQYRIKDTNQLLSPVEVTLVAPGVCYIYNDFVIRKIVGRPLIRQFEKSHTILKRAKVSFEFENLEPGYVYQFSIYGTNELMVYNRLLSDTQSTLPVDLRGFTSGTHLIGIYKLDDQVNNNLISREYSVVLE